MTRAVERKSSNEELNYPHKLNVHNERQHEGIHNRKKKNFKCHVCGYESSNRGHLITHTRRQTGARPFQCTSSGMSFIQQSTLNDHIKHKHSEERPFKCDFPGCLHTAKTHANLFTHKTVHSVERPFACTKCDYKTALKCSLQCHMLRHSARRDFKCNYPHCAESFKRSSDLKGHFSNRHEKRNIKCDHPDCERKFASAKALNDHKLFVHSKKSHVCPHRGCGYRSNKPSNLARHMIVHDRRNENISCPIEGCEYKGKHFTEMQKHKRRHETLLACPVSDCGRFAPTKEALQNHLKRHNPSGRPFQCPLCFHHFQKMHHLQDHCVVHTNEKPFKCGHCEHATARQSDIKTHISLVHAQIDFPFIVHLPDDRECLRCKIVLPNAEFLVHSKGHEGTAVMV